LLIAILAHSHFYPSVSYYALGSF